MKLGLRGKILLIAAAVLVVAMGAAVSASSYVFATRLTEVQLARSTAIARGLAAQLERILALGLSLQGLQGFEEQCAGAVAGNEGLAYAMVVNPEGQVVFHSDGHPPLAGERSRALAMAVAAGEMKPDALEDGHLAAMAPVRDSVGNAGAAIVVGFPTRIIEAEQRRLLGWTAGVGLLALAAGLGLLFLALSGYVIRPLSAFVAFIEETRKGETRRRHLESKGGDELGVMVDGFNRLLDRIDERETELVKAKEAAEAASRAKSTFLATMSHEIRTPMNAIMGLTHLARRSTRDPGQRERLQKISAAADHLLGVINDVLEMSRIEAGGLQFAEADLRVEAIFANVLNLVAERADAKGLRLATEIDPGLPPVLRGDPVKIGQMLANYVANAVKFTERGLVVLKAIGAGERDGRLLVRFEVQDTGIGIAAADLERLFSPFEQADGTAARRYGGTGLGLAITKGLATRMGGEVGVESEPGRGSSFWFTVPLGPGEAAGLAEAAPARTSADRPSFVGAHVLLVEDNPVNQEVALAMLRDAGIVADLAEHGAEALDMARRYRYDLVLMDMQMPVMDGLAATRALREMPAHAGTPIIAMTANAFEEDRRRCLAAGMNDHLAKPVQAAALLGVLHRWLPAASPSPAAAAGAQGPSDECRRAAVAALDRLETLLMADDMAATTLFREMSPVLGDALGARKEQMAGQLDGFDFPAALETLRAARGALAAEA